MDRIEIELKDGSNGFAVVGKITRAPIQRNGYQLIRYKNRRYVLRGGIRNPEFINISNPLKFGERL